MPARTADIVPGSAPWGGPFSEDGVPAAGRVFFRAAIKVSKMSSGQGLPPIGPGVPNRPSLCSFCGKGSREVGTLIEGIDQTFICRECADLCQSMFRRQQKQRFGNKIAWHVPTPRQITARLNEYVVGQTLAKKASEVSQLVGELKNLQDVKQTMKSLLEAYREQNRLLTAALNRQASNGTSLLSLSIGSNRSNISIVKCRTTGSICDSIRSRTIYMCQIIPCQHSCCRITPTYLTVNRTQVNTRITFV